MTLDQQLHQSFIQDKNKLRKIHQARPQERQLIHFVVIKYNSTKKRVLLNLEVILVLDQKITIEDEFCTCKK